MGHNALRFCKLYAIIFVNNGASRAVYRCYLYVLQYIGATIYAIAYLLFQYIGRPM